MDNKGVKSGYPGGSESSVFHIVDIFMYRSRR